MKENIYQTGRGLMAWGYAMMLLFAMICIVILGIAVKYIRLRAAFKRDMEASNDSVLKGGHANAASDRLILGTRSKADFLAARGVESNLHGVFDQKKQDADSDEDDNIPDVPIGYVSDFTPQR